MLELLVTVAAVVLAVKLVVWLYRAVVTLGVVAIGLYVAGSLAGLPLPDLIRTACG